MSAATKWQDEATLDEALSHGLSQTEYESLLAALGRKISILELGICSALFSEHCSYKSTKLHLKNLPTTGPRVLQGPGENAGVVDIGDNQAVVFKVESHNHPTFIEPYQGAATGVGGILRDVFTMGARPLALMNGLRFGPPDEQYSRYLLKRAVGGIGGYGNCMGIPTIGGELFFHPSYSGNCLVNAFALGLVDHDKIFLGSAAGVGNKIIYAGSKTGRDGIHGATMASESFGGDAQEKRPTVQVGDPFQEKLLLEACLEAMATGVVIGIQDMGAAGLTSSSYEMADRAGTGIRVHLDRVPQRETEMTPYEIMLSESQERMLLVVKNGEEQKILDIFKHWELDALVIGEVISGRDVELYWKGQNVSSMPSAVLTSAVPMLRWPESAPADYERRLRFDLKSELGARDLSSQELSTLWGDFIASPNLCSRRPVFNQYDSTVRSNTVIHPGGDAAVIRIKANGPEKGVAMTLDCNSRYCAIDPRQGSALSLAEACRNIAAVGASPIGLSDCLNFGSPEQPEGMWEIAESIRGLSEAARAFEVPIISGNVSLYNETSGSGIYPTPMIALVGLISDASKCVGINFTSAGDKILVIGSTDPWELGGSEYLAWSRKIEKGALPALNYDLERATCELMRKLIDRRMLNSCHDLSSGGLAAGLIECCFGTYSKIGAMIKPEEYKGSAEGLLFSETGARFIVSFKAEHEAEIRALVKASKLSISASGTVGGSKVALQGGAELDLEIAYNRWTQGLESAFG